jgi:hypothetical protein
MVRKNEKSLNSEFGVPLTIIGAESGWHNPLAWLFILIKGLLACIRPTYPHTLIVEVGADHPGDIARIASWLSPHAAVITAVPDIPAHAGYYESPEDVLKEKRELFVHANKDAPLFVNGDDARTLSLKKDFRARTTTFGFDPACDIRAAHYEVMYDKRTPVGIRFRLESEGVSIPVMLYGVVGKTHVYPVLIACAVAHAYGLDYATAAQRFTDYEPAPGRMRLIEGVNGSTIIDDSYNASPGAMHAALDTLADIEGSGRTIALLGDMRELGTHSARAHREVGEHAAQVASLLITVGEESLSKSILRLGEVDFFAVVTRKPCICDFKPVVVEVALARFKTRQTELDAPVQLLRFANRVPLQFDKSGCAITWAIESVNWKSYGLQQPKDSLPIGPYIFAVSVVSPFIKFKNASKETIDASEELVAEIRLALIQAGQKLSRHIKKEFKEADLERKLAHIEQFGPILVESLARIVGASDARKKKAEEGLKKLLGRDSEAASRF